MEQFGIRCCILNSELPINSRLHIVEEFNKNVYHLLIATDETNELNEEQDDDEDGDEDTKDKGNAETKPKKSKSQNSNKTKNMVFPVVWISETLLVC